jgi:hypothetical protein
MTFQTKQLDMECGFRAKREACHLFPLLTGKFICPPATAAAGLPLPKRKCNLLGCTFQVFYYPAPMGWDATN